MVYYKTGIEREVRVTNATRRQLSEAPECRAVSHDRGNVAELGQQLDKALVLFRYAMPGYGLKLIAPPPLADETGSRISLSAWRRGDESARVHTGATAHEAIRRLLDSEVAAETRQRLQQNCQNCRGVGWYIAAHGVRVICTHPSTI